MRNSNKKGFTIVELVIVIAVIAILAAVLIPTFSGIIKKANLSADQKALHDMNTFIAMEGAETEDEAIVALEKHNINVKNLIPISAGYSFVWNKETKQLQLVVGVVNESIDEVRKNIAVTVNSASALETAIADDLKYIRLEADITLEGRDLDIPIGSKVTIDLNGKKMTTDTYKNAPEDARHRYINVSGTLTLQNGTFEGRGIMIKGGNLTVKDTVTINAMDWYGGSCIRNKGGNVTIEGGNFNVVAEGYRFDKNGNMITDSTPATGYAGACAIYNDGEGTITINGGKFACDKEIAPYLVENVSGEIIINTGATFTSNSGVINVKGGTVTVNGGTITWNHNATDSQYMFFVDAGELVLNDGTFVENNDANTPAVFVDDGTFTNNTSTVID